MGYMSYMGYNVKLVKWGRRVRAGGADWRPALRPGPSQARKGGLTELVNSGKLPP